LERKDSMAECCQWASERACVTSPFFGQGTTSFFSLWLTIITNRPNHCQNIRNFNCGLSDCHNIISFELKGYVPKMNLDFIQYRSYKNLDIENFIDDVKDHTFKRILQDKQSIYRSKQSRRK
jgi:hypothetical protein